MNDAVKTRSLSPLPSAWVLARPKPLWQQAYDFLGAPLRMALLDDEAAERLHLTSLRGERLAVALRAVWGRALDVGAGDNAFMRLYRDMAQALGASPKDAATSIGVDVADWGGGCEIVETSSRLPFEDGSFDSVCFIACLNVFENRIDALREARRVLRPGGRLIITLPDRWVGRIGIFFWRFIAKDQHKPSADEDPGVDLNEVHALLDQAGFCNPVVTSFLYGLNRLYCAEPR